MFLHLGCGKRNFPGWINVDIVDLPHIHYKTSIDNLSIFQDDSAKIIYSSHTLEYFDKVEVIKVLKEWRRVLIPGGILRIAVPDIEALIQVYNKTGDLEKILGPLYGRMEVKTESNSQILYHKTAYDLKSLKNTLKKAGFSNIKKYKWEDTSHHLYDDHSQAYFPHMDKENGILISLNVEAKK